MNNFTQRAITGAVYVAVTIGMLLGGQYTALSYIFAISVLCQHEFLKITMPNDSFLSRIPSLLVGCLIFSLVFFNLDEVVNTDIFTLPLMFSPVILVIFEVLNSKTDIIRSLGAKLLSILLVVVPLSMFMQISALPYPMIKSVLIPYTYTPLLVIFIFIWMSDTFAYLGGRWLGKTPLVPNISPKKTWEGLIVGIVCTNGVAFLVAPMCTPQLTLSNVLIMANLSAIFGLFGDLMISRFKRVLGLKDTGNALPGHGGFLDRFDSLLLAAPAVYFYLVLYLTLG